MDIIKRKEMYDNYKGGYNHEYETMYTEDIEGDGSINYDPYYQDSTMMMSQSRNNQGAMQFRNPSYQNYMGYVPNNRPLVPNIQSSFSPKHAIYPQQQRSMHSRAQIYPSQFMGNNPRQVQMNSYPPQQPSGQFVPRDIYEKMVKKYENALKILKAQNIGVIEKLKILTKKVFEQQTMVKDFLLSGGNIDESEIQRLNRVENLKNMNNQHQESYIVEECKQQPDFQYENLDHSLPSLQAQPIQNINQSNQNHITTKVSQKTLIPDMKSILAQKIRIFAQKNNQKVKTQNIESLTVPIQPQPLQKIPQNTISLIQAKLKKATPSISSKNSQSQNNLEDQDNLDPDQPMYPDNYEGEQSFLVDPEVQEKQMLKKQQSHPRANTFGIRNPQVNDFSYHPANKNPNLQRECQIIEQCFDKLLCQYIVYAPQPEYHKYRIHKAEVYEIYIWWRENNKNYGVLKFDRRTIQRKITNEMRRRFKSLTDERQSFAGLMFKNNDILKMMKKPQVIS